MTNLTSGLVLVSALSFSTGLFAKNVDTKAPEKKLSCGQMIAKKAVLPASMAQLMESVASIFEAHGKFIGATDAGKAEAAAQQALAAKHREIAGKFTETAGMLRDAAQWPDVPHDMKAMNANAGLKDATQAIIKDMQKMIALMNNELKELKAPASH